MANGAAQDGANSPANQTGTFQDPYRAYSFKLEIQGVTEGHFTACTGLNVSVHAIAYREAGQSQVVHRLPGPVNYGPVTLVYGLTSSKELWEWFMTAVSGKVVRKNVSIVMMDSDGVTEVMRWNLIDAWPSEWRGATLDALTHEVAVESVRLVFDMLERG
jgi:phage tail-like protein